MAPKLSLAEQKKKLKEKEERAKQNEKKEKEKERGERKAQEQRDKMFGLKNKTAGKAAAGALADAERTLKAMPGEQQKAEAKARENARRKEAEAKTEREMRESQRKSIKQPKVPEGVDPKTIPCEHFKHDLCDLGDDCPFSHVASAKASVSAQLKAVEIHTGAVTKSGAKSKAQLEKEAAEKEAAERKAAEAAEKLAEEMRRAALEADPYYVDDEGVDLDELVALVIRPEPVEA